VTLFRRPATRFVIWAVLLVAVAAGAGFAVFSSCVIAGLVFGAWVIVALSERKLAGPWTTRIAAAPRSPAAAREAFGGYPPSRRESAPDGDLLVESELSSVVRVIPAVPVVEEAAPAAPAPRRLVPSRKPKPVPAVREMQWNVWTLEEVVRENAPGNDELVYLTVSLRDFADANGLLPAGFDPLVRESFGSLLPVAG